MRKARQAVLELAGREVVITNPDKPFFPQAGHTKLHLVRYYAAVAEGALRGIAGRPIVLKRYVDGAAGEPFFQKRAPEQRPEPDPWAGVTECCSLLAGHRENHVRSDGCRKERHGAVTFRKQVRRAKNPGLAPSEQRAKAIPPSTLGPTEVSLCARRSIQGGKDAEKHRADLDYPCWKPAAAARSPRNDQREGGRPAFRPLALSRTGQERCPGSRRETSCGWDRHLGRR